MMPGYEALMRLQQGNRQFVANIGDTAPALSQTRRLALAEGQQPFAIVLGCSDSRVPAEPIFGQGFADLSRRHDITSYPDDEQDAKSLPKDELGGNGGGPASEDNGQGLVSFDGRKATRRTGSRGEE